MGVQLLDRNTRSVQLSEAGREFLPSVHRLLGDLTSAVAGVTDLRDKKKGLLRLAAPQLMACTLMPRVIALYREQYPDVDVRLTDTLPENLLAGVTAGDVELAVGQDVAVDGAIERRTLLRDRHWLICPPGHAFANRRKVRWRELEPYTFIAPTRDFRQRVLPELAPAERDYMLRPATQEVSYMTTALGMVASGLGLTVCPTYSAPLVRAHGLQMVQARIARLSSRGVRLQRRRGARCRRRPRASSSILERFAKAQQKRLKSIGALQQARRAAVGPNLQCKADPSSTSSRSMNVIRFTDLCAQGKAAGQRVFIRADLNVPQDDAGNITEDTRVRASVPCIQLALDAGAAVMVTSHLGRPTEGEFKPEDSLAPVAKRLGELLGRDGCRWSPTGSTASTSSRARSCCSRTAASTRARRRTTRRWPRSWPRCTDIYVNDAFGTAHRAEATTYGIAQFAKIACGRPAAGGRDRRHHQGAGAAQAAAGGHRRRLQGQHQAHHPQEPGRARSTS